MEKSQSNKEDSQHKDEEMSKFSTFNLYKT